jgi:hypothetical protein
LCFRAKYEGEYVDPDKGCKTRMNKEQLHNLHSLHNVIEVIKARRLRWAGHMLQMVWIRISAEIVSIINSREAIS